jgi:outer membrane receptor protein involved in Fe transport
MTLIYYFESNTKFISNMNHMKYYLQILVVLSFLLISNRLLSQEGCDEYKLSEARKKYEDGNFDQVIALLTPCLKSGFAPNEMIQAYKILSSTYFAIDSINSAVNSAAEILKINPNFEPDLFDSPQFSTTINKLKQSGQAVQITSVSKKAENLLQAPATVIVITDDQLINRGYQYLGQILSDVPGFDVIRANGPLYCNFYQRGYRSINNDRTLLLIDGVEENDLVSDNIFLSRQYPLTDIKRIEIVHGPASTMYGANAFVGVINIISKDVKDLIPKDKSIGVNANVKYGTFNTKVVDATLTGRFKDITLSVTGRLFHSDEMNLDKYPEWNFNPKTADDYKDILKLSGADAKKYLDNNKTLPLTSNLYTITYSGQTPTLIEASEQGRAKAAQLDNSKVFGGQINNQTLTFDDHSDDWFIKVKLQFKDFTMGYINWNTNEGSMPWYTVYSRLVSEDFTRWSTWNRSFYLNYNKSITENIQITNLVSYKFHEIDGATNYTTYKGYYNKGLSFLDLFKDVNPSYSNTYLFRGSNQIREELRCSYVHSKKFDIISGLEFRNSIIQGNYVQSRVPYPDENGVPIDSVKLLRGGNNFRSFDIGFFSQANYNPYDNLKIVLGVRWDYNRIRTHGGYGTVFNPRIAVVYSPGKFVFKAIYAEAFKDASYFDKYATTNERLMNNPTLQPEKVKNLEFSAYYEIIKNLSANVVFYNSFYSNVIGSDSVTMADGKRTTQFAAIGKQNIKGIQAEINYKFHNLNAWFNYTFTDPQDEKSGLRISDIAEHSFNIGASYTVFNHLNLIMTSNYVGERKTGTGTYGSKNPATSFDPFFLLNAVINYQNLIKGLDIQFSINNLLNKEYFVPGIREADNKTYASRLPQDTRNIMIGLIYNLK